MSDVLRWTIPMVAYVTVGSRLLADGTWFTIYYWPSRDDVKLG